MKLDGKNVSHVAKRLLTEDDFSNEILSTHIEKDNKELGPPLDENEEYLRYGQLSTLLDNSNNKTYFITKSVTENLELFDTKKAMTAEGWKIFDHLPDFKKTFILPSGDRCIRIHKYKGQLHFIHLEQTDSPKDPKYYKLLYWILLYVNLQKGELCEHMYSDDGKELAPFLYALLCFIELTDNQEILIPPGHQHGTKKSGKIINSLNENITIVNNTWNITTIRTDGFPVKGHAALRWSGEGRSIPKMVYIEPYMKFGYTRRSGKENSEK